MQLFEHFNQVGVTVLIASHDLDLISTMPYTQISLHQGCLLRSRVHNSP
jgi:cell division transport system ATP-binding protein